MNIFKRLFFITPNKSIQEKTRNRTVLECLRALEFGAVEIRQALVGLNRIKVKELAKVDGVSAVTIYNTIKGRRTSPKAQELIARSLNLSVEDLFPGGMDKPAEGPEQSRKGLSVVLPETKEPQACTPEAPSGQLP